MIFVKFQKHFEAIAINETAIHVILRRTMAHVLGAQMQNVNFIGTGCGGQMDFIVA
jgi:hypothetical protein